MRNSSVQLLLVVSCVAAFSLGPSTAQSSPIQFEQAGRPTDVAGPVGSGQTATGPLCSNKAPDQPAQPDPTPPARWWGVSAYSDSGFRSTQFFEPDYDTTLFQADGRLEVWLPPSVPRFSYGPYVRLAASVSTRPEAWENWAVVPGVGFQVFPFSSSSFAAGHENLGQVLGPTRLFAEYNRITFRGDENSWRPGTQTRAGLEYWNSQHVNVPERIFWAEEWTGLIWSSANEFDASYNTLTFGNVVRVGARVPGKRLASWLSPYGAVDSSLTNQKRYPWENRLRLGGGLRCSPPLSANGGLNRLVLYAEYLRTVAYYTATPVPSVPVSDVRVGLSFAVGDWFHRR